MKKVVTLGFFDGVHRGHIKIIGNVIKTAKEKKLVPLVLTFEGGRGIKDNKAGILTPREEKIEIIRTAGIPEVKSIRLTGKMRAMTAGSFFKDVLIKKFNAGFIVVGDDFRFGKNRSGDVRLLSKLSKQNGTGFRKIPALRAGSEKVSSSKIRALIARGRVQESNRLLGREYSMTGRVIKGRGFGTAMGFPTANLKVDRDKLLPVGVFKGSVDLNGKRYVSVANIGIKPTFGAAETVTPEVYLKSFTGNLLGRKITFYFHKKLRNEKKFSSIKALKNQIIKDVKENV